jgi:LacI family transcriptional regulator
MPATPKPTPSARPPQSRARRGTGRAVLDDVARLAGVSTATVSRAFNDPDKVSPLVRERVRQAALALDWLPNAAGRALASTRSHIAGTIIPTLDDQVFASLVGGTQSVFAERGITLFLGCSNYDPGQALKQVQVMLERGVEAMTIVGEAHPPEVFEALTRYRVPYVVTYSYRADSPHPCVGFDNHAAFARLTGHLLALGHRRFAVVMQPARDNDRVRARMQGLDDTLARHGLTVEHRYEGEASVAFARASLRAIWSAPGPRPTAILCGNDHLAFGVLREAAELGIAVPQQLSVTGFDDVAMAREQTPALTTMRVDTREIGRQAARHLLQRLDGGALAPGMEIVPELCVRASTAVAP